MSICVCLSVCPSVVIFSFSWMPLNRNKLVFYFIFLNILDIQMVLCISLPELSVLYCNTNLVLWDPVILSSRKAINGQEKKKQSAKRNITNYDRQIKTSKQAPTHRHRGVVVRKTEKASPISSNECNTP